MADISKINAVLIANIAEIDDVLAANIAKVNGLVFSTAPAFTGLLDTYTGAAAAFSTRRLYSLYTGAAMRVRRDSDDTEQDIGFDSNGDLDTAAIATFVGSGNNGYVTKWYGQESSGGTGSGVDALQSGAQSQPKIYDGTSVYTENNKPLIPGLAVGDNFELDISVNSGYDIYHAGKVTFTKAVFMGNTTTGNDYFLVAESGSTSSAIKSSTVTINSARRNGSSHTFGNRNAIYTNFSSQHLMYLDASFNFANAATANFEIGYETNFAYAMWGAQELIFYPNTVTHTPADIEGNINAHFQIGNFGTPTSGLLATYTGAAAAYSVRQLANTAALAMRIREDGTDTETDIGFDSNGDLATADIAAFCGSNNGYVVTWYDQAGSQNDADQQTSGRQPQIYNGTAVLTENGKPALQFDGGSDNFDISWTQTASNYSLHAVTKNTATDSFLFDSNTGRIVFDGRGGTRGVYYDGSWKGTMHSGTTQQLQSIYAISPSSGQSYIDGSQINTGLSYSQTAIGGSTVLGAEQAGGALHFAGTMQEWILYASDQTSNRTGIETNINTYFSIY